MAYDASSAYQPPRRQYYAQAQAAAPPPPTQNGYHYQQPQEQYQQDYYAPAQQYEQGYGQDYNQWGGGYDDMRGHQPYANEQYESSSRSPRRAPAEPQSYGHGYAAQPTHRQRDDRQFDPRYQQRPGKGPSQSPNRGRQPAQPQQQYQQQPYQSQQSSSRNQEQRFESRRAEVAPQQSYESQSRSAQHTAQAPVSRPNPRNARMYPGEAQSQQPPQHPATSHSQPPPQSYSKQVAQAANLPMPPPIRESGRPSTAPGRPSTAPQSRGRAERDPAKMTMEEWKAKERARMHADAAMPEAMAWDNAFPVFPTVRERSKARSGTSSARASGEFPRPGTSSSNRHERRSSKSRAYSDTTAAAASGTQLQPARPHLDHKSHSYDQPTDSVVESPTASAQTQYRLVNPSPSPVHQSTLQPQQLPTPPPHHSPLPSPTPLQRFELPETDYGSQPPPPQETVQPRQPPPRGPMPQPIETRSLHDERAPSLQSWDQQPLNPAPLQTRSATSGGQRADRMQQPAANPLPALAHLENARGAPAEPSNRQEPQRQSWSLLPLRHRDNEHSHEQSYEAETPSSAVAPTPTSALTRDDEIEAEMPDFDSAAPGGTSLLHKRNQQLQESPTLPSSPSVPALPLAATRGELPSRAQEGNAWANVPPPTQSQPLDGYQQPQSSYNSEAPGLDQRGLRENVDGGYARGREQAQPTYASAPHAGDQRGLRQDANGFVYGRPEQENPRKIGASYGQSPPQQMQPHRPPPQSYATEQLQRPPQPPYANEQPRRSMDDGRQMPQRPGPPSAQRPYGQPQPRDQYAPQSRSNRGRNTPGLAVQTSLPPSGRQDSINSAPPTQQSFRELPPRTQSRTPLTSPSHSMPESQSRSPDALPHHPVPVRPGHIAQPPKPAPVRNHGGPPPTSSHQRQPSNSASKASRPVTAAEIQQLQSAVTANPSDNKRALLLVKKLVEASSVLASDNGRADRQTQARNREKYIGEAEKRLKKLVSANYPDAQFYLADCYGQGTLGHEPDAREAFRLYQAAAKGGHAQAAYRTAMCCELGPEDGGTSKDFQKAVQWYRRGAALGDSHAMFKIGVILLKGLLNQPKNITEAVSYIKRAVEHGGTENPQALYELGQLYDSAQTSPEIRSKVPADNNTALDLFHQAASVGHRVSQFRLGQAYEYGNLGTAIDNRASITWYTKAAAQGEHNAELALSGWYLTGSEGILAQSDTEAYLWARKAAAATDPPLAKAMFAMGYFTETGIGCPKNGEEARRWYARAASYHFPKAQERLEELRRNGSKGSKAVSGRPSRKDQKKDEENCAVM